MSDGCASGQTLVLSCCRRQLTLRPSARVRRRQVGGQPLAGKDVVADGIAGSTSAAAAGAGGTSIQSQPPRTAVPGEADGAGEGQVHDVSRPMSGTYAGAPAMHTVALFWARLAGATFTALRALGSPRLCCLGGSQLQDKRGGTEKKEPKTKT